MDPHTIRHGLTIHPLFQAFVEDELLPGLELSAERFWAGLAALVAALTPENHRLLAVRDALQAQLDAWHQAHGAPSGQQAAYRAFLQEIGYLETPGEVLRIRTANVDPEIALLAGPQLVVPVDNARFALNAANARWGSLYDALYGSDVIDEHEGRHRKGPYNPQRGAAVMAFASRLLDEIAPLEQGRYAEVAAYRLVHEHHQARLVADLADGRSCALARPEQFVGFHTTGWQQSLLLRHHGLHLELRIDREHPVGRASPAGLCDVELESALTTICDCEDSVAAVDAADKVAVYRNWLGLMRGDLVAAFDKAGHRQTRRLAPDREYQAASGGKLVLPGRSLLLVRNVGHLMRSDAVLDAQGEEVFEGLLDAVVTSACALHDLRGPGTGPGAGRNSRAGSVYIVKPKMHGSAEVAFADRLFAAVEDLLGLPRFTLKIGVMDEERRTTLNLPNCIAAVADRLVFINTGFLDRTGDEIHSSMEAGPVLPKEAIKEQPWIKAYEDWNVDVGIRCGLPGRAQIGKGMWPKPDEMRQMLDSKAAHPMAGASCAWVPSPTAATLHALHYHQVDVAERQRELAARPLACLDDILSPPLGDPGRLDAALIQGELDNNVQGILGYVVRWIDQGVGCSRVPDIHDVGLMEDRATLRISSQHIANWLRHGVCTRQQVLVTLRRMAAVVDAQNAVDPAYAPMAPGFDGQAFQAACELVFEGCAQPNGYTEPLLHARRRLKKMETRT